MRASIILFDLYHIIHVNIVMEQNLRTVIVFTGCPFRGCCWKRVLACGLDMVYCLLVVTCVLPLQQLPDTADIL